VLVIECQSRDGSRRHFERLTQLKGLTFDWLEWPLRPHPDALDVLFRGIAAERVLLLDSDAELLGAGVVAEMSRALAADSGAYGSGFLHRGGWMGAEHRLAPRSAYYAERMWIPCVLLRTEAVRDAIRAGGSFANRRIYPSLSGEGIGTKLRSLACRLQRPPLLGAPSPSGDGMASGGPRPIFFEYDTGAALHGALRRAGHSFAAIPEERFAEVRHYHGVTRAAMLSLGRHAGIALGLLPRDQQKAEHSIAAEVHRRLTSAYGVDAADLERG
jgi:hypothetical protein